MAVDARSSLSSSTRRNDSASIPGSSRAMSVASSASVAAFVFASRSATMASGLRKSMTRMGIGSGGGGSRAAGLDETVVAVLATVEDRDALGGRVQEDDELVAQEVELHHGVLDLHRAGA